VEGIARFFGRGVGPSTGDERTGSALAVIIVLLTSPLVALSVLVGPTAFGAVPPESRYEHAETPPAVEMGAGPLRDRAIELGAIELFWDGARYVVVMPAGSKSLGAEAFQGLAAAAPVAYATAHVRQADIDAVMQAVSDLAQAEKAPFESYFDVRSGYVVVEGPVEFASAFSQRFPGLVTYIETGGGPTRLADRQTDREPFKGGVWLTDNRFLGNLFCSSGFPLKKNSVEYMVTAGHCKEVGAVFWTKDGATYGQVEFRKFANNTIDAELLGDYDYGTLVYDGDNMWHSAFIDSGGNPVIGASYCTSGAGSLQECGKTVEATNVQFCADGICTVKTAKFTGGNVLIGGDSGGPFYFRLNANCVAARGIIVGKNLVTGSGYAQMWNPITTEFNGTLIAHDCYGS
jgi:hypothetical protein